MNQPIWLFDLDDTLHDAASASMPGIHVAMGEYMQRELRLTADEAHALRRRYWQRYGATLLGLVRHHGVKAAHFLHDTHRLPGLEARVSGHRHDFAAIKRLRGRKLILTNAPRAYAMRVLGALRIEHLFDAVISIEDMWMFGHLRPKPDARMLRALCARLRVHPSRCMLVEDTLEHQKAARRVGIGTVWMRRYAPRGDSRMLPGVVRRPHTPLRPVYVDRVVRHLRMLEACAGLAAAHPVCRCPLARGIRRGAAPVVHCNGVNGSPSMVRNHGVWNATERAQRALGAWYTRLRFDASHCRGQRRRMSRPRVSRGKNQDGRPRSWRTC